MERFKAGIRPGLAIWAMCMLTLLAFKLVVAEAWLIGIWVASIGQWIPDRAIKRIKEAWKI